MVDLSERGLGFLRAERSGVNMKPRHKLPRADKDVQVIETPALELDYIFDLEQGQFIRRLRKPPVLGPVLGNLAWPAIKVVLVAVAAGLGLLMVQASMPILHEPILGWVTYAVFCAVGLVAAFGG